LRKLVVLVLLLLIPVTGHTRPPPTKLTEEQLAVGDRVAELAVDLGEDPIRLVAHALVESMLTPDAVWAGNYGVLQINCFAQRKNMPEVLGTERCRTLLDLEPNVVMAVFLLNKLRSKYKKLCGGPALYSCYNGGPGWRAVIKRCPDKCGDDKTCMRLCMAPISYARMITSFTKFVDENYRHRFLLPLFRPPQQKLKQSGYNRFGRPRLPEKDLGTSIYSAVNRRRNPLYGRITTNG
jgi:hypothetical protein